MIPLILAALVILAAAAGVISGLLANVRARMRDGSL